MEDRVVCSCIDVTYNTIKEAIEMINAWLETEFKGGRYKERLDMLEKIENENMK